MRDDLNEILAFIGTSSLTDDEWDGLDLDGSSTQVEIYTALLGVLESREAVSETRSRLQYYYQAKGVEVSAPSSGRSNIFVGSDLCG